MLVVFGLILLQGGVIADMLSLQDFCFLMTEIKDS
jgi:hypothetical protein